eukprot:1176645-Rhodomonas_salina.2
MLQRRESSPSWVMTRTMGGVAVTFCNSAPQRRAKAVSLSLAVQSLPAFKRRWIRINRSSDSWVLREDSPKGGCAGWIKPTFLLQPAKGQNSTIEEYGRIKERREQKLAGA